MYTLTTAELIAQSKFYKAKCGCCRRTAIGGPEINDAIFAVIHAPNCDANKTGDQFQVHYDCIDLRIAGEDF